MSLYITHTHTHTHIQIFFKFCDVCKNKRGKLMAK